MTAEIFKLLVILTLFVIQFTLISNETLTNPIVKTDKGVVQGQILRTVVKHQKYSSFKGIPYAKPPLGKLRFKPPIEIEPWYGILKAVDERDECVQLDQISFQYNGSENCLFLNVHTPELKFEEYSMNRNLRAVMVWIHGGSFKAGSGHSYLYGPDFFIEEGVIIVTFNYRLGPFGFLALNHPDAMGNAGLKDQNMVLKWVKRNIINFGGDPNNILLFGESAGGVSVDFHVLSDMSKGLFHRSISMSASPLCPWAFITPRKMQEHAFKLGTMLNNGTKIHTEDELLKILYEAPALDIMQKTEEMSVVPPFVPTVENPNLGNKNNTFLSDCYMEKYLSGNYSKLPHMMGFTSKEALLFGKGLDHMLEVQKQAVLYLHKVDIWFPLISIMWNYIENVAHSFAMYTASLMNGIINIASDVLFYTGIDLKQRLLHETGTKEIYYYRISFDARRNSYHQIVTGIHQLNGTSHADDLFYLFYIPMIKPPLDPINPLSITRRRIVRLWSNFAKYGNPTPFGEFDPLLGITWPTSGNIGTHLDIGNKLRVKYKRPVDFHVKVYEKISIRNISYHSGCIKESLLSAIRRSPLNPVNVIFSIFTHLVH